MKRVGPWSLLGILALALPSLTVFAQPIVFHSSETACPGDVIGLQGANFGTAPQVWMQHVIGTESSLSPQTRLTVLNFTNSFASALIPTNETSGLYVVWVKDGFNLSGPVYINRARAWGANDLAGLDIDSGRVFRLFGRNLCVPGATPAVRFVNGSTSLQATLTVAGSDPYMLNVTAPTLVVGTTYDILVNNGYGGAYGDNKSSFQLKGRAGGTDAFGVGVPWGADFGFAGNVYNVKTDGRLGSHAVGDGVTDDTAAIQGAINAAHNAGGGVVYFPAGTYKVTISSSSHEGLVLASSVVLQGAGSSAAQILLYGAGSATPGYGIDASSKSLVGFVDITLHNTTNGGSINLRGNSSTKVFALRTVVTNETGTTIYWNTANQGVIKNCTIANCDVGPPGNDDQFDLKMSDDKDIVFVNNTVTWHIQYVEIYRSVRTLIEGNHFTRDTYYGTSSNQKGGFYPSGSKQVVIHANILDKSGSGQYFDHNDGETILEENCNDQKDPNNSSLNRFDLGTVTSATSTTLTDSSKNWSFNYATPLNANTGRGFSVAIVNGPGFGQWRKITASTANTLTVDRAWDVIPTSGSRYTIQYVAENYLIHGNSLLNGIRGIWIFSSTMQDLSIVQNTLTDCEGIWLRTDYRPADAPERFNAQWDVYLAGNKVTDVTGRVPAFIGKNVNMVNTNSDFGCSAYAVEFRNNAITGHYPNPAQEFGLNYESYDSCPNYDGGNPYPAGRDNSTVSHLGVIFQNNCATNCSNVYEFCTGDYYNVVWNTTTNATGTFMHDQAGSGTTHASIGTVIGSQGTPAPKPSLSFTGQNPVIGFQSFAAHTYSVQYSSGLRPTNWVPLPGGSVLGDGWPATATDTNQATARFYRVSMTP